MSTTSTLSPLNESNNEKDSLAVITRIAKAYQLTPKHLLPSQKGYRNTSYPIVITDDARVNVIIYKHESGVLTKIRDAERVARVLAPALPVRHQIDPRIVQLVSNNRRLYSALYNYLPGHTIPWEAYTKDHLKLLGEAMSILHAALQPHGRLTSATVTDEYLAIIARMTQYFADSGVQTAMRRKLHLSITLPAHLTPLLQYCAKLHSQQALHMDFVRGNILFAEDNNRGVRVSGILDFEKTGHGHPMLDIARTLAFLLVDCKYTPEAKVRKYFLHSGYQKRGRAALPQLQVRLARGSRPLLELLVELFLLHDFYKFLRHNPYEFLPQNEHFIRTKRLLVVRGLLRELQ